MEADAVHHILSLWPILLVVAGLICTNAVALYRISQIEKRDETFMTNTDHAKDCKIAALEIKDYFRTALAEFSAKLLLKMDEQQKPVIEAINKNADMITRLDRRTRHLKDVDS